MSGGGGMSKANQRQNTRHKSQYTAYFNNDMREKNKAYKIIRHLERHPLCKTAIAALESLPSFCVKSARLKLNKLRRMKVLDSLVEETQKDGHHD